MLTATGSDAVSRSSGAGGGGRQPFAVRKIFVFEGRGRRRRGIVIAQGASEGRPGLTSLLNRPVLPAAPAHTHPGPGQLLALHPLGNHAATEAPISLPEIRGDRHANARRTAADHTPDQAKRWKPRSTTAVSTASQQPAVAGGH